MTSRALIVGSLLLSRIGLGAAPEPVDVMYGESLSRLFSKRLGPGFEAATGLPFAGQAKGMLVIAKAIKTKARAPDVFICAEDAVLASLYGQANGNLVSWWLPFARTEMVIAWSPKSIFRGDFETVRNGKGTWESVLQHAGFRLGRSDPETAPRGYRTLFLFQLDEERTGERGLARSILGAPDNEDQIFPGEELVAQLKLGRLDASILYLTEAIQADLPYLRLPALVNQGEPTQASHYARASYTTKKGITFKGSPIIYAVTIPNAVSNPRGAETFVRYLLSDAGKEPLSSAGLQPVPRLPGGTASAIPSALRSYIDTR